MGRTNMRTRTALVPIVRYTGFVMRVIRLNGRGATLWAVLFVGCGCVITQARAEYVAENSIEPGSGYSGGSYTVNAKSGGLQMARHWDAAFRGHSG